MSNHGMNKEHHRPPKRRRRQTLARLDRHPYEPSQGHRRHRRRHCSPQRHRHQEQHYQQQQRLALFRIRKMRCRLIQLLVLLGTMWATAVRADDVPSLRASSTGGNAVRSSATPSSSRRTNGHGNGKHKHHHHHHHHHHHTPEYEFAKWCKSVLGITSALKIEYFEYYDYMRALKELTDQFSEDDDDVLFGMPVVEGSDFMEDSTISVKDYPRIRERGLAASHDIQVGETLIQIPYQSLWTVENAIDLDPILSKVMGVQKRQLYGWDGQGDSSMRRYYELPLLAIALLHHCKLGKQSPHWPYLKLLQSTSVDNIPFTWDRKRLRVEASVGVRRVARGIQRDVHELYAAMVQILIEEYPELFGRPELGDQSSEDEDDIESREYSTVDDDDDANHEPDVQDDFDENEWMFSFSKFQWAFAIVNSRHWHLPVPSRKKTASDTDSSDESKKEDSPEPKNSETHDDEEEFFEEEDVADYNVDEPPPASMPTDEWVRHQQRREEEKKPTKEKESKEGEAGFGGEQSFMLPFAELLNFGPPCTRGFFNKTSQSFEIVATCPFLQGQEVTFWYSDACSDVIMGNYGFTHPMVPKCASLGDWKKRSSAHEQQVDELQLELISVYEELRALDDDLGIAAKMLTNCDCPQEMDENIPKTELSPDNAPSAPRKTAGSPQVKLPRGTTSNIDFDLEGHDGIRSGSTGSRRGSARIQQLKRSRHRRQSSIKSQPDL